jgi:hypothetical protein
LLAYHIIAKPQYEPVASNKSRVMAPEVPVLRIGSLQLNIVYTTRIIRTFTRCPVVIFDLGSRNTRHKDIVGRLILEAHCGV